MFAFSRHTAAQDLGGGVVRKVLAHDGSLMMVEVTMARGARGDTHAHAHEQISYIAAGGFEFELAGDVRTLKAGDSVYVPPGAAHGVRALADGSIIVDVFTPIREDFLRP